jgi:PIN domain nuclease of toxin-antitoxin system
MTMLLDTHVLDWVMLTPEKIGRRSRKLIEAALHSGKLCVSSVSFWEMAQHVNSGRIKLNISMDAWRMEVLALGIQEVPLDGAMAIRADGLLGSHKDPGDRFITATALALSATLVTADQILLAWKSPLKRQNAKE